MAVLSSDALSSVAYATEETLRVLILAGSAALALSLPIAAAIIALLLIVALSYRQTIHAYPSGGGAYVVAKENLGVKAGLVAGAALMVDYVLTAAVSVAAGTAAVTSALPSLFDHRVPIAILFLLLIAWGNLRGVRESGAIFAVPTFAFIVSLVGLIAAGLIKFYTHGAAPVVPPAVAPTHALTLFLVLRAFSSGCTALTGIEAISNGVQAFRPPEARNAARTLAWMAFTLMDLFGGISLLSHLYGLAPRPEETVVSQLARSVFGNGPSYFVIQAATALILILAANTSYADFPRLASLIARDGFLPRQFAHLGERLVYSGGIVTLTLLSTLLVLLFKGNTHALIPLYAVGVFLSFTLSQSGMVQHWRKERPRGWVGQALINGLGAVSTGVVLVVIAVTKFTGGAWIVLVLIPLIVGMFVKIRDHYDDVARQLRLDTNEPILDGKPLRPLENTVVLPVAGVNRASAVTVAFARSISADVRAVHIAVDKEAAGKVRRRWEEQGFGVPLTVVESPYRSVIGPLIRFIESIERREPDHLITVVIPEFVVARWWHHILHNQTTLFLKGALLFHPGIIVVSVPYHLKE